jgi:hypothetical protein
LQIGIHRDDVAAVSAIEAGRKGRMLTEVCGKLDDNYALVALLDGA